MVQKERIKYLNKEPVRYRKFVVYWMQASQRTEYNHALEYAIHQANELSKPLVVYFGLTDNYPEANERHYAFMIQGLREVKKSLEERGITMVVWHKSPEIGVVELARDACLTVVDRGYTRIQRMWRRSAAGAIGCPLIQVESDVVVPVEEASPKEEYTAATFRPKINKKLSDYLLPLKQIKVRKDSLNLKFDSFDIDDVRKALARLNIDRSVQGVKYFMGGTSQAKKLLKDFIENKLDKYPELRNDLTTDAVSRMSPYLHFGQISPLYITLKIRERKSPGRESYLEELIVRRELSMNFVFYNSRYDHFQALPEWCRNTLKEHEKDKREYAYSLADFENARTHDPYWNAAQKEMVLTGKMHGYMRMYWGKKILEWSKGPEEAFKIALYLNNKYELDGRDPNGFTGVAWCFGKHDRPWPERPVFGKVRSMSEGGLRKKFDADEYVRKIDRLSKN